MEPFTVYKYIRGRLPDWYFNRCRGALLKLNGDHFRGRFPFTLQLTDVFGSRRGDGWLLEFTFSHYEPTYIVFGEFVPGQGMVPIGQAIAELHGRVDLRSLGLV